MLTFEEVMESIKFDKQIDSALWQLKNRGKVDPSTLPSRKKNQKK